MAIGVGVPSMRSLLSSSCSVFAESLGLQSTADGGRLLCASRCITADEDLLVAPPDLLITVPHGPSQCCNVRVLDVVTTFQKVVSICDEACSTFGPIFYWAGLAALVATDGPESIDPQGGLRWELPEPISDEVQSRVLQLFCPSSISSKCQGRMDDGRDAAVGRLVSEFRLQCQPEKLEKLVLVCKYNSFDGCMLDRDSSIGLSLFFAPSFCNHSCSPSCSWRQDKNGRFVLAACADGLAEGDDITISYLSLVDLEGTTAERRDQLAKGWTFFCQCDRCDPWQVPACNDCGGRLSIMLSGSDESPYGDFNVNCDTCGLEDLAFCHSYFGHCFPCGRDMCPACIHA